jgi:ubiquinol-cytochrome c reductase cytochrome b subunit/menaquinol-cytochrome c reductase cytochrome b/c subunit
VVLLALVAGGCGADDEREGQAGAAVAQEVGCLSCHRIGPKGNEDVGSDLTTVGSRLTRTQLRAQLVDPPTGMPPYDHLPADDLDALLDYLSALR